jgi:hypothetical protein
MVIVSVRARLTNWFFRRGGEFEKLVIEGVVVVDKLVVVGVGESLTNWLL